MLLMQKQMVIEQTSPVQYGSTLGSTMVLYNVFSQSIAMFKLSIALAFSDLLGTFQEGCGVKVIQQLAKVVSWQEEGD